MRNIVQQILLIGFISISCSANNRIDFDSERWKNWIETESTVSLRWDMREGLIKKHKLINLDKTEIIKLLGEPEKKYSHKFQYNLGAARHGIDYGTLTIEFESEKVIDFEISKE
jgi:hypothetical protein